VVSPESPEVAVGTIVTDAPAPSGAATLKLSASPVSPERESERAPAPEFADESASPSASVSPVRPESPESPDSASPPVARAVPRMPSFSASTSDVASPVSPVGPESPERATGMVPAADQASPVSP
jgi:hypothetical protein